MALVLFCQEDGEKKIDLAPGQLMEHDHDVRLITFRGRCLLCLT